MPTLEKVRFVLTRQRVILRGDIQKGRAPFGRLNEGRSRGGQSCPVDSEILYPICPAVPGKWGSSADPESSPPWPVLCLLSCRNKKVRPPAGMPAFHYGHSLSIRTPPPALRPVPLPCEQGRFTGVGRGYGLPRQCAHWLAMTNGAGWPPRRSRPVACCLFPVA